MSDVITPTSPWYNFWIAVFQADEQLQGRRNEGQPTLDAPHLEDRQEQTK